MIRKSFTAPLSARDNNIVAFALRCFVLYLGSDGKKTGIFSNLTDDYNEYTQQHFEQK